MIKKNTIENSWGSIKNTIAPIALRSGCIQVVLLL